MWSIFSRDSTKDFPFEIDASEIVETNSIWKLCKGRRKTAEHEDVSVFIYDIKTGSDVKLELARESVKRLKTLRHPGVLAYIGSAEADKLYVATDRVTPLADYLKTLELKGKQRLFYLSWGIFQITRALNFLVNDCGLRHNNVSSWSVFVNYAGEWKLGGLEYVRPMDCSPAPPIKITPSLEVYDPPEKEDQARQKFITKHSNDMWGLGCLLWESFNGPLRARGNLKDTQALPKSIVPLYVELVGANPSSRPNPKDILTKCQKPNGFFRNDLIDTMLFLEEIQIKDKVEKGKFFASLTDQLDNLPETVCRHRILPQLITAYEYGDAGSSILAPLFKLGRLLDEAEYQKKIVPCVVKLFGSTDRVTRSRLLLQMELFIPHLQASVVNDQIFPQVAHGFLDTNPTIREQTVKSIIHLAPKLNYNNLNVEMLRHFARLQARDDQGGIRTNTTVCLGKIAVFLHPEVRQRVLISAFVRALRDPFPPARIAGILALAATQQYYLLSEVATKILPNLFFLSIDPDKSVRDPAFKTIKGFLNKLERVSEDPTLKEQFESDVTTATPSMSNNTATWAGWVTSKFYRGQISANPVKSSEEQGSEKPLKKQDSSGSIKSNATVSSVASLSSPEEKEDEMVDDNGSDGWEGENWGDMDATSPGTSGYTEKEVPSAATDGWDDDESWGSIEEPKAAPSKPAQALPQLSKLSLREESRMTERRPVKKTTDNWDTGDGWGETEFEPVDDGKNLNSQMDEAQRKREEKKQQRMKELEAKRAARGPMKLGVSQKDKFIM